MKIGEIGFLVREPIRLMVSKEYYRTMIILDIVIGNEQLLKIEEIGFLIGVPIRLIISVGACALDNDIICSESAGVGSDPKGENPEDSLLSFMIKLSLLNVKQLELATL